LELVLRLVVTTACDKYKERSDRACWSSSMIALAF